MGSDEDAMGRELVLAAREGQLEALNNLLSSNAPLVSHTPCTPPPPPLPQLSTVGTSAVGQHVQLTPRCTLQVERGKRELDAAKSTRGERGHGAGGGRREPFVVDATHPFDVDDTPA